MHIWTALLKINLQLPTVSLNIFLNTDLKKNPDLIFDDF